MVAPAEESADLARARAAYVEAQHVLAEACDALARVAHLSRVAADAGIDHIESGGLASQIPEVTGIRDLRREINAVFAAYDAARIETRSWTMALAAAEGTSLAAIAKGFGGSRQYASKLLAEHPHEIGSAPA